MYPAPLTYDLNNLQGQFIGLHDLILTSNSKRDSHSCISCDNISQILVLRVFRKGFLSQTIIDLFF